MVNIKFLSYFSLSLDQIPEIHHIIIVLFTDCITGKLHSDRHKRQMVCSPTFEQCTYAFPPRHMFCAHHLTPHILCQHRLNGQTIAHNGGSWICPPSSPLFARDNLSRFYQYRLDGNVRMPTPPCSFNSSNFIHNIHTLDNFAEYRVPRLVRTSII